MRLTRKVFNDLALWMIGLGLLIGFVFPFFITFMGVPSALVIRPWFFMACMTAGLLVGAANITLAKIVVGWRMRLLVERMQFVESNLEEMARGGAIEDCTPETCMIEVDSEDEIGETSKGFNHLVEALANFHRVDAAVREFNKVLASHLEMDILASQALQQLLLHIKADAGALLIETDGEIQVAAVHRIRSPETLASNEQVRLAFNNGQQQRISLPEDVTLEGVLTDFRPREILIEPIDFKQTTIGVIILARSEVFADDTVRQLELLRQSLAFAFNNALTHERLQRLAALDPLTGVYNRRFGMARLHEEFSRAVRQNTHLAVLMFDIDHFKKVNDTYGHLAGDRILVQVSRISRSAMRDGDILIRYGGEEFLAILPAASKKDGYLVGERLRRVVAETSIKEGAQEIRVTISIGVTAYPELSVESERDLVESADKALYIAKDTGRNRVVAA